MRTDWQGLCTELLPSNFYSIPFNRLLLGCGSLACMHETLLPLGGVSAPAQASIPLPISFPTHTLLPCNKAFVFCIWCSICAPQQQKKLKLPCKALHPARTWGSHGTCRWSGCSTRSHRSWSIRHWQRHQGDLSPESIPEHCHFHCHRPPCLTHSPCPSAVAQQAAGPALQCETALKLRSRSGDTV